MGIDLRIWSRHTLDNVKSQQFSLDASWSKKSFNNLRKSHLFFKAQSLYILFTNNVLMETNFITIYFLTIYFGENIHEDIFYAQKTNRIDKMLFLGISFYRRSKIVAGRKIINGS